MHEKLRNQLDLLGVNAANVPNNQQWKALLECISNSYQDQDDSSLDGSLVGVAAPTDQKQLIENQLQTILDTLPDALFLIDENGRYLDVLAGADKLIFHSSQEIINKTLDELFSKAKAKKFHHAIDRALASGEPQKVDYQLRTDDKEMFFEGRIVPTKITEQGLKTVVFLSKDITETKELNRNARLLDTVINGAQEGVVIISDNQKVVYANPAMESITGYSAHELMAEGQGFLRHDLDKSLYEMICEQAREVDRWQSEISIHHKEGGERAIWLSLDTLRNDEGEIDYFVALLNDVTAIHESRAALEHVATHDSLTSLPNRALFEVRLEQAVSRSLRQQARGALLLLDLDRFKQVNDSLGHAVGDNLLIQVAERLQFASRMEDTVARFGGDEFTIVLEDLDSEMHAARVAEKILQVFQEPVIVGHLRLNVSTSIGISIFPEDANTSDLLLQHADAAMYVAKAAGGGQYSFYTQNLSEMALANISMQSALRRDLTDGVLELVYQPQFRLDGGELVGMEALVRWPQADGSVAMPGDFIGMAEVSGLIEPLGLWVLSEVCKQGKYWRSKGIDFKCLSVNVSSRQLANPSFSDQITALLEDCDLLGSELELEVTESMVIHEGGVPHQNLDRLHALGIKLAIDDFGTGHSSLVNLKRFPLSRLKIDQSFIRDVGKDANDEAIVGATIALAKELGMEVIAEGVETEQQASFLEMLMCDVVQGHFYSKPLSAEEIEARFFCEVVNETVG